MSDSSVRMGNVQNFLKMDLTDLLKGTPLSEEGGVIEFRKEAEELSEAMKRARIDLTKVKDGRARALFLMRNFYLLGVLRGGEAARTVLLVQKPERERPDLSGGCARLFLSDLAGLDSLTMESLCKTISLR